MLLFPEDKEYGIILKTKLARKTYGACKISINVKKIEFLVLLQFYHTEPRNRIYSHVSLVRTEIVLVKNDVL